MTTTRAWIWMALPAACVLAACSGGNGGGDCPEGSRYVDGMCVPVDADAGADADPDAGRDADTTEDSGPGITCEARCLRIPSSWEGPILLRESADEMPACPDEAPVTTFEAGREPNVPDLECDCSCGDPMGDYSCGSVEVTAHTTALCGSGIDIATLADGECSGPVATQFISTAGESYDYFRVSTPELSGSGSCEPSLSTTRPDPSFATRARACDAPRAGGSCEEGSACVGGTDALCVYVEGDAECPAGFPARTVVHRSLSDERTCTDCGCDSPEVECTGSVPFRPANEGRCDSSLLTATLDVGTCERSEILHGSPEQDAKASLSVTGTCAPTGGAVEGEVTPAEPITVCCEE